MESIKPASIKVVLIKKYFYQDIKAEADTRGTQPVIAPFFCLSKFFFWTISVICCCCCYYYYWSYYYYYYFYYYYYYNNDYTVLLMISFKMMPHCASAFLANVGGLIFKIFFFITNPQRPPTFQNFYIGHWGRFRGAREGAQNPFFCNHLFFIFCNHFEELQTV